MKTTPAVFVALVCAGLAGCATMDYLAFQGEQRPWPTAPGALVKRVDGIPIYYGLPERPYQILGVISAIDASDNALAQKCKAVGGDAIVIANTRVFDGGTVTLPGSSYTYGSGTASGYMQGNRYSGNFSGSGYTVTTPGATVPVTRVGTTARVIKFRDPVEVQIEQYSLFLKWADSHPNGATLDLGSGETVSYTAEQIATRRAAIAAELQQLEATRPDAQTK